MIEALPTLPDSVLRTTPDPDAGFGALRTEKGALPLVALGVNAHIDGLIAGIEMTQTYFNCHEQALEATYVFPLPDRAAVTSFRLEVAGRVVEGELQERGQARRTYDAAIRSGHRAAIAEEERAGVFTMRVGNLPPGERATVRLTLVGPLPYSDGEVTFRFPLVVAPRYVPGTPLPGPQAGSGTAADTDASPDASRISPPTLLPGFPNPVRLAINVTVADSPLAPHSFRSTLYSIVEEKTGHGRRFRVEPGERLDRDFILRWRLAGEGVGTSLVTKPDAKGGEGTFLLTVVPPAHLGERVRPREVVFVLDRSGSMSGWKMVAARRAVSRMVETLTDQDRFTVYAFDYKIVTPPGFDGVALVPATDRHRYRAAEFLNGIDADGGTEMAEPLRKAAIELTRTGAAAGVDRVLVLITDGQVSNEDQILKTLAPYAGQLRIFTLGIDRAVNAAFLRRLADLGGGASEVVESEQRLDEVMDQIHRNVGTPLLTGLTVSPAGLDVLADTLVPSRLPDLFFGAPVVIAGRYRGPASGAVVLRAIDADGARWAGEAMARCDEKAPLDKVWGRGRVRELEDRYAAGARGQLEREIVATSLSCGVLSRFTSYVAVDRAEVVNPGGRPKQATQAVEMPAGWGQADALMAQAAPAAPAPMMRARGLLQSASVEDVFRGFAMESRLAKAQPPAAPPPAACAPAPPCASIPPAPAAPSARQDDASSEFELTLDDSDGASSCDLAAPDFDVPALDESGSEAQAIDAADGGDDCEVALEESEAPSPVIEEKAELMAPRAAKKTMLSRQVSQELNAGGRVSKKTQLAVGEDAPTLWERVKAFFGIGQAKQPAAPDVAALRSRAESLRQRLEAAGADPAKLKPILPPLRDLVRELLEAGEPDGALTSLAYHVRDLDQHLGASTPAADLVLKSFQGIIAALREWLGVEGQVPPAGGREFWK